MTIEFTITNTNGTEFNVLIDDVDSDLLQHRWFAHKNRHAIYIERNVTINGKKIALKLHRVILERKLGTPIEKGTLVDHADLNPLNNTRSNLRSATPLQNTGNRPVRRDGKTGVKGVSTTPEGKYRAAISSDGKMRNLGTYLTIYDASKAYEIAAKEKYGEFARWGSKEGGGMPMSENKFIPQVFEETVNVHFVQFEDGSWCATYELNIDAQGFGDSRWEALMDMAEKLAPTLSDEHS